MPDAPPLYTLRLPVRWGDMDALGHVNNAVYLTYFEQARIEYLRSLSDDPWPGYPERGPVLVAADAVFKKPVVHPATVVVRLFGGEPGRSSFPLDGELTVEGDEETVYATLRATIVWVDHAVGRSVPLPDVLRQRLAPA